MLRRAVETFLVVPCVIGLNQRELCISSKLYVVLQNDMSSLTITKPLTNGLLLKQKQNMSRIVGNKKCFQLITFVAARYNLTFLTRHVQYSVLNFWFSVSGFVVSITKISVKPASQGWYAPLNS